MLRQDHGEPEEPRRHQLHDFLVEVLPQVHLSWLHEASWSRSCPRCTSNRTWGKNATKNDRTIERKLASPLYDGHIIYNEDLAAIKQKKKDLLLNKPIYAGMCILDLSKLHMYRFHYDVIKKTYQDKAKLLFTDTDSLCYYY